MRFINALLLSSSVMFLPAAAGAAPAKPNVVVILCDDGVAWGERTCRGGGE